MHALALPSVHMQHVGWQRVSDHYATRWGTESARPSCLCPCDRAVICPFAWPIFILLFPSMSGTARLLCQCVRSRHHIF